eukprot:c34205_g1_i1 orf=354-701(+)
MVTWFGHRFQGSPPKKETLQCALVCDDDVVKSPYYKKIGYDWMLGPCFVQCCLPGNMHTKRAMKQRRVWYALFHTKQRTGLIDAHCLLHERFHPLLCGNVFVLLFVCRTDFVNYA